MVLPLCVKLWQRHAAEIVGSAKAKVALCHEILTQAWQTTSVVPPAFVCGAMACVFLPTEALLRLAPVDLERAKQLKFLKKFVHDELLERFAVEVPVFVWRGELAVRVSVPSYVQKEHIEKLAAVVLQLTRGLSRL